jgi:membrane associated rhomboid family serine protease
MTLARLRRQRLYFGSAALLSLFAAIFLVELVTGAVGNDARLLGLGALPDSGGLRGEYWRLISFGFLHGNFTHFALNGLLLLLAAPVVERRAGFSWLLILFLSASVASGIGIVIKHQFWPSPGASVGASGGLFGLLAAAIVLAFRPGSAHRTRIVLLVTLAAGLAYSVLPGISMVGHVVGLAVGAAIAFAIPDHSSTAADNSA